MPAVTYPSTMTKAGWEKEKGLVAKVLKKETGIGAACEKVETAFKKINWSAFDGGKAATLPTVDDLNAYLAAMKTEHDKNIIPTREATLALSALATKVAGEFKAAPLIPKSSREYVEKIAKDASNFLAVLKGAPDPGIKAVQAAIAKKAVVPKLKEALTSSRFKAVEANPKLMAAFRDYLKDKACVEQLDALQGCRMKPSGDRAIAIYLKHIKEGAPQEANIPASVRKVFDAKYDAASKAKNPALMTGLPWDQAATLIINEMLDPMVADFNKNFEKYYTKYL